MQLSRQRASRRKYRNQNTYPNIVVVTNVHDGKLAVVGSTGVNPSSENLRLQILEGGDAVAGHIVRCGYMDCNGQQEQERPTVERNKNKRNMTVHWNFLKR